MTTFNRLLSLSLLLVLFTLGGCRSSGGEQDFSEEMVSFAGGSPDVTLAGTLSLPLNEGPYAGVVLISGSGPSDRDETIGNLQPFQVLANALNAHGYAVLRHDDRGVGESTGDYSLATVDDFAADTRAAMDYLATDHRIRPECLVLIGHSEGGYIGPIAAAARPPAALVLLAGAAQSMPEVVLDQQMNLAFPEEDPAEVVAMMGAINDIVRWTDDYAEAGRQIDAMLSSAGLDEETRTFYVALFASPWWQRYLSHNPAQWLMGLDLPVLALYGEKDVQVRAEANAPLMHSYLMHPAARVEVLANLNHLFQVAVTGMPEEYMNLPGEVFDISMRIPLFDWLDSVLPSSCRG